MSSGKMSAGGNVLGEKVLKSLAAYLSKKNESIRIEFMLMALCTVNVPPYHKRSLKWETQKITVHELD
jgi:hypothetical protein